VPKVLVASDAAWVRDQVRAALVGPNFEVIEVSRGQDVRKAVDGYDPDLVIVDMQIGNMGGMAVSLDLRLEESADRLPYVPILLLLDREADRFLGRRSEADAMLVKPFDAGTLRRTVKRLLEAEAERQRAQEEDEAETDGEAEAGSG
jgi:DNA-binding response OmpR family regulator